jgi:hypothetical protein
MTFALDRNRLGLAFAKEIEACWSASFQGTYSDFARDLRRIERKYVVALKNEPPYALEVRRRAAEYMLQSAIAHKCTIRLCSEKLKRNLQLGFTDRWREVHFRLMYAEALLMRGNSRTAIRMVGEVINVIGELEKEGRKYDKRQAEVYRTWVSRIEAESHTRGNAQLHL